MNIFSGGKALSGGTSGSSERITRESAAASGLTRNDVKGPWAIYYPPAPSNDPTKAGSASDRAGRLHREEWYDYLSRFQPYDQKLLALATGDGDNKAAIQRSRESVGTAFDVATGSMQRDLSRMGLSEAADERSQRDASTGLARAAAEVSAVNGARLHTQDRDMKLMSGDMATGLRGSRIGGN